MNVTVIILNDMLFEIRSQILVNAKYKIITQDYILQYFWT